MKSFNINKKKSFHRQLNFVKPLYKKIKKKTHKIIENKSLIVDVGKTVKLDGFKFKQINYKFENNYIDDIDNELPGFCENKSYCKHINNAKPHLRYDIIKDNCARSKFRESKIQKPGSRDKTIKETMDNFKVSNNNIIKSKIETDNSERRD